MEGWEQVHTTTEREIRVSTTKKKMYSDYEDVTPQRAKNDVESRRGIVRPIDPPTVDAYMRDMKAGLWDWDNPQGLAYDDEGFLIDGGHRLTAMFLLGENRRIWVTRNATPESLANMDTGRARTAAQRLLFSGYTSNANTTAAVARQIVRWQNGAYWSRNFKITNSEILAAVKSMPEIEELAKVAAGWPPKRNLSGSQAAFCWWVFSRIDNDDANVFMTQVRNGTDLKEGDPAWELRERLFNDRLGRTQNTQAAARRDEVRVLLTFLAWRSFRKRISVKKIQLPSIIDEDAFHAILES